MPVQALTKIYGLVAGHLQQDIQLKLDMVDMSFDIIKLTGQHHERFFADENLRDRFIATAVGKLTSLQEHITVSLESMRKFGKYSFDDCMEEMVVEVQRRHEELGHTINNLEALHDEEEVPAYFSLRTDRNPVAVLQENHSLLKVYIWATVSSAHQQALLTGTLMHSVIEIDKSMTKDKAAISDIIGELHKYRQTCTDYAKMGKYYPKYFSVPGL